MLADAPTWSPPKLASLFRGLRIDRRRCCRSLGLSQLRVFFKRKYRRGKVGQLEGLSHPVLMECGPKFPLRLYFLRSPFPTEPLILIIGFSLVSAGSRRFRFKHFHQSFYASDALLRVLQYTVVVPHPASCSHQPVLEIMFVVLGSRRSLPSAVQRRVLLNNFTTGRFR